MRVKQCNNLRRLEAVEKDSRPNQPMHHFSFEHESIPRLRKESNWGSNETETQWDDEQFLSDEDGNTYSTMHCFSQNIPNLQHKQNSYYAPSTYLPTYHLPHHANSPILTCCVLHMAFTSLHPPFPTTCLTLHLNSITPLTINFSSHSHYSIDLRVRLSSPIKPKKNANILSSTSINRDSLISLTQTFAKYHKRVVISKAPTLATKLTRDAFFGENVLRRCTVMGGWNEVTCSKQACVSAQQFQHPVLLKYLLPEYCFVATTVSGISIWQNLL